MARAEIGSDLVSRLVSSYAVEAGLYASLLTLAQEQGALLGRYGDVDRCAQLFERKDQLLRSIAHIEAEIEPLKRRWRTEDVEPQLRQRLNSLLDAVLATIEAIVEQEERNEQLLLRCSPPPGAGPARAGLFGTEAEDDRPEERFLDAPH